MVTMELSTMTAVLGLFPPSGDGSSPPAWTSLPMILIMVFVFYFILIRPQQKKAREHDVLVKTLRSGDKVLTSGGICGTVVGIKEKTVSIRSADAKIEVLKSSVSDITERGAEEA